MIAKQIYRTCHNKNEIPYMLDFVLKKRNNSIPQYFPYVFHTGLLRPETTV